jgi:hypothetical protein
MQLRRRLELQPETISDFAASADQKYWEGLELVLAGHRGSGIYLMGYTAEMILKIACFRFDGAATTDLIGPRLGPVRTRMRSHPGNIPSEGYHSLRFWCEYLRYRRATVGRSLDSNLDGLLVHHVKRIYCSWWVEMRYRPDSASTDDVRRMFSDVKWLRENQLVLWR